MTKRLRTQWLINHPSVLNRLAAFVKRNPQMVNYRLGHWLANALVPALMYVRAPAELQAAYRAKYLQK